MAKKDVHELDDLWDAFGDERFAHEYVRDMRWPAGIRCAHCEHDKVYETKLMSRKKDEEPRPSPRLQWKCADCGRKLSVTTNTPMERSHVPLRRWLYAIRHFPSAKNTQAALEISRMCKISYETAWFMMQRIREMMRLLLPGKVGGHGRIVEVDEA